MEFGLHGSIINNLIDANTIIYFTLSFHRMS